MDAVNQVTISRRNHPVSDPACDRFAAASALRRHAAMAAFAPVVVAPEVVDRIVARRTAGERTSAIGRDLKMTPREVHTVLRQYEHGAGTSG